MLSSVYEDGIAKWVFNNTVEDPSHLVNGSLDHAPTHNATVASGFLQTLIMNNDTPPIDPSSILPKSRYFPHRGLVYVRSSNQWADQNDIQFSLTAQKAIDPLFGVFSIRHDQPDRNSITLSAFGEDFIVDVGYPGRWPADQNYILIDNKGEAILTIPSGGGWQVENIPREGNIAAYTSSNSFDFIHGDAKLAFGQLYMMGPNGGYTIIDENTPDPPLGQEGYLNPVINADRFVLSERSNSGSRHYVVVADDINKNDESHIYKWLFNTDDACASGTWPLTINRGGKQLKIWYQCVGTPTINCVTKYRYAPENGPATDVWGYYGQNEIQTTAVNPYFHVILLPYDTQQSDPTVTTPSVSFGSCFKLAWPTYEDYTASSNTRQTFPQHS